MICRGAMPLPPLEEAACPNTVEGAFFPDGSLCRYSAPTGRLAREPTNGDQSPGTPVGDWPYIRSRPVLPAQQPRAVAADDDRAALGGEYADHQRHDARSTHPTSARTAPVRAGEVPPNAARHRRVRGVRLTGLRWRPRSRPARDRGTSRRDRPRIRFRPRRTASLPCSPENRD